LKAPRNIIINYINLCNELEATSYTAKTKKVNNYIP